MVASACAPATAAKAATATRVFFISKFSKGLTKGSGYGTPGQPPFRKLKVFDQSRQPQAKTFPRNLASRCQATTGLDSNFATNENFEIHQRFI
jgi:hypothetical protein